MEELNSNLSFSGIKENDLEKYTKIDSNLESLIIEEIGK